MIYKLYYIIILPLNIDTVQYLIQTGSLKITNK